jgi:3-hydroxyisobutyrate dehydrogenase-like beta-hydroxyacid dehydrogenase
MAQRLLASGFDVLIWNRSPEPASVLAEQGATLAPSPADLAERAPIVLTSLADPAAVASVYLGADGLLSADRFGSILVDCSTVSPELSRRLADEAAARGARFLDAPVAGSVKAAAEGTLVLMVGGDRHAFDQCQPVFSAIGRATYHLGPNGAGSTMKLASNAMLASVVQALAEAIALGEKAGLDLATMFEVLAGSSAGAPVVAAKAGAVTTATYAPATFTLRLMHKDLWLALTLANQLDVPMPATRAAHDLVLAANAQGMGALDFSAVVRLMEQLAGASGDLSAPAG